MNSNWDGLSLTEVDLILNDQKDLYTKEELNELRLYRKFLIEREGTIQDFDSTDDVTPVISCPKCGGPNEPLITNCAFCGHRLRQDEDNDAGAGSSSIRLLFGFLFTGGGVFSVIHGNNLNNSIEAQWDAYWSSGTGDPGTAWIIAGVTLGIIGIIMLISALFSRD